MKPIGAAVAVVVSVAALAVGGWQLGWWLEEESVNRRGAINDNSYERQTGLIDAILSDIREADGPAIPPAQRAAIVAQICDNYAHLTGSVEIPLSVHQFAGKECS